MKEEIEEIREQLGEIRDAYEAAEDEVAYLSSLKNVRYSDPALLAAKAKASRLWGDFCILQNRLYEAQRALRKKEKANG